MLTKMLLRKSIGIPALSFNTSGQSTSSTITIPAGAAIGDLAVLLDWASRTVTAIPSTVVPTDWTSVSNQSSSVTAGTRSIVSYKKLVSGDPGASITGMNGTYQNRKQMIIFSPSVGISSITVAGLAETIGNVNPAAQVVAAQTLNYVVIGAATSRGYDPVWTTTWYDQTFSNASALNYELAYKLFNASPASVSMDFTASSYDHACIQAFALVVT